MNYEIFCHSLTYIMLGYYKYDLKSQSKGEGMSGWEIIAVVAIVYWLINK